MKGLLAISSGTLLALSTGCAGPIGQPLGLGPGWGEIAGVIFLAVVVGIFYRPIGKFFISRYKPANFLSPQDIVKVRYARGEITQEEFQRTMQHLSQS